MSSEISENQKKIVAEALCGRGNIFPDPDELKRVEAELKNDPENYYLWAQKGLLNYYDAPLAEKCFTKALTLNPLSAYQHYNRGRKYQAMNKWWESLADLELACALNPTEEWCWYYLGTGYYCVSEWQKAIAAFEKGIETNRHYHGDMLPTFVYWLWMIYAKQLNDVDGAKKYLDLVDENTPVLDGDRPFYRCIMLLSGRMSVAEFLTKVDYSHDKLAATDLYGLANYYYHYQHDIPKCIQYLDQIIALKEDHTSWGYRMAIADRPIREQELKAQ